MSASNKLDDGIISYLCLLFILHPVGCLTFKDMLALTLLQQTVISSFPAFPNFPSNRSPVHDSLLLYYCGSL